MLRCISVSLFWLALSTALCSCGSDESDAESWRVVDPTAGDMAEGACENDEDCGEDAYCHEPSDCTSLKYCADGDAPKSAAPPGLACGCDGRVISIDGQYPGRHAWKVGFGGVQGAEAECDADAEFPVEYALRFVLPEDRPTGLLARLSWGGDEWEPEPVPDDGVLSWRAMGESWPEFDVTFLIDVDVDGDGACSLDDEVFLAHPEQPSVNLDTFEVEATLRLQRVDDPCGFW